jgi:hypothetical protein
VVSLVLMERADRATIIGAPPASPRAVVVRHRRPSLRPGVVVAWIALLLLIPFLVRGLNAPDVDAAPNKTISRSIATSLDDVRHSEDGGLIGDEAVAPNRAASSDASNARSSRSGVRALSTFTSENCTASMIDPGGIFRLVKRNPAIVGYWPSPAPR